MTGDEPQGSPLASALRTLAHDVTDALNDAARSALLSLAVWAAVAVLILAAAAACAGLGVWYAGRALHALLQTALGTGIADLLTGILLLALPLVAIRLARLQARRPDGAAGAAKSAARARADSADTSAGAAAPPVTGG